MKCISEVDGTDTYSGCVIFSIRFKSRSLSSGERNEHKPIIEPEDLRTKDVERTDSWEHAGRERDVRQGIDLATTLERIEKNFVISDPRLPDNPIVRYVFSFTIHKCMLIVDT